MDLTSFSADNFNPVSWINDSFKQIDDKEKFASDSVLKLQLLIQGINKSLEDSSKKIITNLDKVKGELITLNNHAINLKIDLDKVQSELSKIQLENNEQSTITKLIKLDELKNRMQETYDNRKEADNWSTLSKEMEMIIKTNELELIATKLICMQKSLTILTNVPDYVNRVCKLNEFKNLFIRNIQPKLSTLLIGNFNNQINTSINNAQIINHLKNNQLNELDYYIYIFKELDKFDHLKEIHRESICHQFSLEWQKIKQLNLKDTILDWLNSYFDYLNLQLINQIKIVQKFTINNLECSNLLIIILIDLFNKINDDLISNLLDFIDIKSIDFNNLINSLILIKTLFDKLNKNIYNNLILKLELQLNLEQNLINNQSNFKQLLILINQSYRSVLKKYFNLEQDLITKQFKEIQNVDLIEYSTKTFQVARDCEKRCYLLTKSVYLFKFLKLINLNFNQSINYYENLLDKIKDNQINKLNNLQINQIKFIQPDWNLFQQSLNYLQSIGDFMVQFDCFQQQIFNSYLDLMNRINMNDQLINDYYSLYLNLNEQQLLKELKFDSSDQLFLDCYLKLKSICNEMLNLVLLIPINYIRNYIEQIELTFNNLKQQQQQFQSIKNQNNDELFKLSLTPNEYITQIGQYLLTIPQHIEHFIIQDNISLKCVFKHFDQIKYFNLSNQSIDCTIIQSDDVAEFFLNLLIEKIVHLFIFKIDNLNLIDQKDRLHLIVDCEYLNEVIEDLGLPSNQKLNNIILKLKN